MRRQSIIRQQEGATAIEFAVVLPVMVWLVAATLEFSMYFYATALLDGATNFSSRMGKTGFEDPSGGTSREQMIRDMIDEQASALLDVSKIEISTLVYSSLTDIGKPEPFQDTNRNGRKDAGESYDDVNGNGQWDANMGAAGLGGAEDIVLYTVTYPWEVVTPFIASIITDDGILPITSAVVVKNEPYETPVYGG